jgi:hypothetical protein
MSLYSKNIRIIKKPILFKFKMLMKVIFKYKSQNQHIEKIQIGTEYVFVKKLKGKKNAFE